MKATMRRDAWLVIAGGFTAVLNMPKETERIKQLVIKQGPNNAGPLTIEFPDGVARADAVRAGLATMRLRCPANLKGEAKGCGRLDLHLRPPPGISPGRCSAGAAPA